MRYVYTIKSATLHPTTLEFWFGNPTMKTSMKLATKHVQSILNCNRAEKIVEDKPMDSINEQRRLTYMGEEGKYKGLIIVEKHELQDF